MKRKMRQKNMLKKASIGPTSLLHKGTHVPDTSYGVDARGCIFKKPEGPSGIVRRV